MATAPQPQLDLNPANNNNFMIVLSPHVKDIASPPVQYFARTVNLPGWSMPGAAAQYQNADFSMPSNSRTKDELSIEFMLTERMSNLKYFRRWSQMGQRGEGDVLECFKDISIIFLDSNKNPIDTWRYLQAFPIMMTPLSLDHGIVDTIPLVFTVAFMFAEEVWDE